MSLNLSLAGAIGRSLRLAAALLAAITFSCIAGAQEKLLFAGFAFSGDYAHRADLYPFSAKLFADNPLAFDDLLRKKVLARPKALERLNLDLGTLTGGTQLSVAFALNFEDLEIQELDGKYLAILRLYASVLAFDRSTMSLVATYPVRIRYSTAMNHRPSDSERLQLFRNLYFNQLTGSDGSSVNAFDEWLDRFESVGIQAKYSKYLRVTNIRVDDDAARTIGEAGKPVAAFRNQLAQALESAISYHNNVPVVPSNTGEAVGSKMAFRFANGNALELKLPEPDYAITFTVRGFRYKAVQDGSITQDIYRVLAGISIEQPDLGKSYINEKLYNTLIVTKPAGANLKVDAWPTYYKVMVQLINELAQQFVKPNGTWIKEHLASGSEADGAFERTSLLFKGLR